MEMLCYTQRGTACRGGDRWPLVTRIISRLCTAGRTEPRHKARLHLRRGGPGRLERGEHRPAMLLLVRNCWGSIDTSPSPRCDLSPPPQSNRQVLVRSD
jgi:hypothetical protein